MLWHKAQGAGGVGAGSVLIEDTFTDTNGTSISSHTPDTVVSDTTYTEVATFSSGPAIEINSNRAQASTGGATRTGFAVIDAGTSDCIVQAEVNKNSTPTNFGGCGIAFRSNGSTAYTVELISDNLRLRRWTGSSSVDVSTESFPFSLTTTYTIKAVLDGSSIEVYVDDTLYISTTDSTYSGTQHGISCTSDNSGNESWADNFFVSSLAG
jgi:sucrose-6-phosphate hydrolase SacC (GH32 family)